MFKLEDGFWNKYKSKLCGAVYAFAVTCCLPALLKWSNALEFTYSGFAVILFALILWSVISFWQEFWRRCLSEKILTGLFAFAFLLCMAWGRMLDTKGYLDFHDIGGLIAPVIAAPYVAMLISRIYSVLEAFIQRNKENSVLEVYKVTRKELTGYFIFLIVCWGLVLLGVFPGFFVYDAGDELLQVITRQFTTHHPLLHVLYMGGVVQAGYKIFGSYNAGIFLFSMMQMVLFAGGIVYMMAKMHTFGFGRWLCRITVVFMGIFPVFPMCVLCSAKDSIFTLVLLLWVLETYEWFWISEKQSSVKWVIWSALLCLLRHNALYALLVTGGIWILFCKKHRRAVVLQLIASVVIVELITLGLARGFHVSSSEHQEILTVPIQQIARTYQLKPETFSDEEKQLLYTYLPEEYLTRYKEKLSDGVKIGFVNEVYEQNPAGFWQIWFAGMQRASASYLNAWLMTSYGYWYPDTIVDVYAGNTVYTFTYGDNAYFGYETEQPGERASLIPPIDNFYRRLSLEIYKEKIPVVSMLFSQGFAFWMLLFCLGYLIKIGGFKKILPYIILVLIIATLLLGPTFLPRYVFFLWFCMPFIVGDMISGTGNMDAV